MTTKVNGPRVLVADDEKTISDTLAIILTQCGFDALAVYSGEEALAKAATFHPDMLLSDVVMTGIDGVETAIRLRAQLPDIRILLFSGQAATANLLERARAQGEDFELLAKPVHPKDLLAKLREIPIPATPR